MGAYAVSKAGAEALVRGFAADLEQVVGVVDPGYVATDLSGDTGRDPDDVAPMFVWAARDAEAEAVDGEVLDLRAWKSATR
jgi:NAD(P)-dependent dehydrogenase (short-subunit alcohol dehydrogenase family)